MDVHFGGLDDNTFYSRVEHPKKSTSKGKSSQTTSSTTFSDEKKSKLMTANLKETESLN
jgi:hypothetical protein